MTSDPRARLSDARLYLCTDSRRARGDLPRFLDDLAPPGVARVRPRSAAAGGVRSAAAAPGDARLADRLRAWRRERAKADEVPPYVVFNDRTLAALATQRPRSRGELLAIDGIGPTKLERYGDDLLGLLGSEG